MLLPRTVLLTDGYARLAEDGIYLHGFSELHEHVSIQTRQTNLPDIDYAGRLFFNHELVDVRSEVESEVIYLLNHATFADSPVPVKDGVIPYTPSIITGQQGLTSLRNRLVEYLLSDEYVDIAKNGVLRKRHPWEWR